MKTQYIEVEDDMIGGELLENILESVADLYEQELLDPPFIDHFTFSYLVDGKPCRGLLRTAVVDLMGRAAIIRAELAAGFQVPKSEAY